MRREWRWLLAVVVLAGLVPALPVGRAVAADAVVSTCTNAGFSAALGAVQNSGGGTITFTCSGTINFNSEKTITSHVTILGGGSVTFDGQDSTRLFWVNPGATLELVGLTLQNGNRSGGGGAIENRGTLKVTGSTFSGNRTGDENSTGGAIYNRGTLEITASTFSGNSASTFGGAIDNLTGGTVTVTASTFSGNSAEYGGAIAAVAGTLEITASTFSGNSATNDGGAIDILGSSTVMTITASTFSGNSAGDGGIIDNNSTLTVTASTFSGNDARAIRNNSGTVSLQGTILANSDDGNCDGTITSEGYNLSDDASCGLVGPGDVQNSPSINLGSLADNGGPTETMLPLVDSAAIDTADCSHSSATDQRGVDRPQGVTCDKGAVELGDVPIRLFPLPARSGLEGDSVPLVAVGAGPADLTLSYAFDCDSSGDYETPGSASTPIGAASASYSLVSCTIPDDTTTLGVQVCDALNPSDCSTGSIAVDIANVAPTVDLPVVDPSPSDEGQSVIASATFSDPGTADTHTCTVDYGDGSGPQAGMVDANICTGPAHTYLDDDPTGTASDAYTVTITVTDDDLGQDTVTTSHTVNNLAPVIESITTNAPVPQGQPVTVTVTASDPGIHDVLSYAFDCDNDGSYDVGPQSSNSASCALDPSAASTTIGVQVSDDDLGVAVDSITVGQTVIVCGNRTTGALAAPLANGSCPSGTVALSVPAPAPMVFCINPYTNALIWSPRGTCGSGYRVHLVPDDGPLAYCQSIYTGKLRYSANGTCSAGERPGVIPG